jgi:AraC family transcriptional regulator, alkane utilization regulator
MTTEGLSAVLNSIKVSETGLVAMDLFDPWSIEIEYPRPITVTVVKGRLWLSPPDGPPEAFDPGDSFILPRGISRHRYVVSSSPSATQPTTTRRLEEMGRMELHIAGRPDVSLRRMNWGAEGGEQTRVLSFTFDWKDRKLGPLIEGIPELIRVRGGSGESFMKDLLLGLDFDTDDAAKPGFQALIAQLAQLFLVQAIRSYALREAEGQGGLLAALADAHLSRALSALHSDPAKSWSVDSLAACAGLSRSVFARHFKEVTGHTPMTYLRSWRLHLARRALCDGDSTVSSIAFDLGYKSEAAFRASFRQETGLSPREYAKMVAAYLSDSGRSETDQSF